MFYNPIFIWLGGSRWPETAWKRAFVLLCILSVVGIPLLMVAVDWLSTRGAQVISTACAWRSTALRSKYDVYVRLRNRKAHADSFSVLVKAGVCPPASHQQKCQRTVEIVEEWVASHEEAVVRVAIPVSWREEGRCTATAKITGKSRI